MSLSNLDNKVFLGLMALVFIIALIFIATFVFDVTNLSALSTSIYELAGDTPCSGCIATG